ncbi:MAG: ABC transporter permease [Oscillospiraceae bacterium]|nr:ABC transporter permease [Oscillospiraceae bacterium]
MEKYRKNLFNALACFLVVIVLNFALPRLLPGDPVAYLTGFSEEEMTVAQIDRYRAALHLDESVPRQFLHYLASLADGTLGYSYKKEATVAELIRGRIGYTLQIALPAVVLSSVIGLAWGLACGYRRDSLGDKLSSSVLIVLNTVPSFLIALAAIIFFCFQHKVFPYTGVSSPGFAPGVPGFFADRLRHLALPVLTLTLAAMPSRYLLMRNTAARLADEKYILYAKERGLSPCTIQFGYMLKNIAQPFITMLGMSVSLCIGGSLIIENIFSVSGMGKLLTDAVYTLDYPLMQGVLFVTTLIMVLSIIITDFLCILVDPKVRLGEKHE